MSAYNLATGARRWNVLVPDGGTANDSIQSFENLTIDNNGVFVNYHLYYGEGVSTRDKTTGAALPGLSSTAPFGPSPASDKVVRDDASAQVTQTGRCALGVCAWFLKYGDLSPTSTTSKKALVATSSSPIPPVPTARRPRATCNHRSSAATPSSPSARS